MATAIGKLGFVAYPAGGGFTLLVLSWFRLLPHLLNLFLIGLKLLVQLPASKRGRKEVRKQRYGPMEDTIGHEMKII